MFFRRDNQRPAFRVGDVVDVRGTVSGVDDQDHDGNPLLHIDFDDGEEAMVEPERIVRVVTPAPKPSPPRPLIVGERVKNRGGGDVGTIVHIDGDRAWVKFEGRGHDALQMHGCLLPLAQLERVAS